LRFYETRPDREFARCVSYGLKFSKHIGSEREREREREKERQTRGNGNAGAGMNKSKMDFLGTVRAVAIAGGFKRRRTKAFAGLFAAGSYPAAIFRPSPRTA